jgi:hypothetical protein
MNDDSSQRKYGKAILRGLLIAFAELVFISFIA